VPSTPTRTATPPVGGCLDLNGDGRVTGQDVAIVARAKGSDDDSRADVNGDGDVDNDDLKAVIQSMHDCRSNGNGNGNGNGSKG
jgi:hypothetical protein